MNSKYRGILAGFYEADHYWRDYRKQSEFVCSLFIPRRPDDSIKILDLACGPGVHARVLSQKGFQITGVDDSEEMLNEARSKMDGTGKKALFLKEDVFSLDKKKKYLSRFDGAILLGWSLVMEPIYRRFSRLLQAVYHVLIPGGLFVFDVAIGMDHQPISREPLRYHLPSGLRGVLRISQKMDLEKMRRTCRYDWTITKKDGSSEERIRTEERLCLHSSEGILSKIKKFEEKFTMVGKLRDYDLGKKYRKGDKNLVVILKKLDSRASRGNEGAVLQRPVKGKEG